MPRGASTAARLCGNTPGTAWRREEVHSPGPSSASSPPRSRAAGARRLPYLTLTLMPTLESRPGTVVTREQCLTAGLTDDAVEHRIGRGRWRRLHRGVYLTGPGPATEEQRVQAALLAIGGWAVAGRETALWLADRRRPAPAQVHVEVLALRSPAPRGGVRVHRVSDLGPRRVLDGRLPRTRVPVAAVDVAAACRHARDAVALLCQLVGDGRTHAGELRDELTVRPRVRHRAVLEAALAEVATGVQSPLELEHARLLRRHGLPPGRRQVRLGPAQRADVVHDCPDGPVVTELDGRLGHEGISGRFRDAARDNRVAAAGGVALRYGWRDVTGDPCGVAEQTAQVLRLRGWRGPGRPCGPACPVGRS